MREHLPLFDNAHRLPSVPGFCLHVLLATAATNVLTHKADIAKVQEWLGHANIVMMRFYDRR